MKRKNFYLFAILTLAFAISFTSCKKDEKAQTDTSSTLKEALAESIFDNVSNISDEAYSFKSNSFKSTTWRRMYLSDCATVSLDTNAFPRTFTIDFGTENCLCNDGRYRRGKILVTFTGRYFQEGTVITHEFEDYYVNDNKIEGTKVVTNMGENADGFVYFDIQVVGVVYLALDGGTVSWNSSRTRVWVEGSDTFTRWDDVYEISGMADGIRVDGTTWEREIIIPLRKELGCRHFVSGSIEIRPEGESIRLLDYGDGECDNIATLTIDGVVYTIFLH